MIEEKVFYTFQVLFFPFLILNGIRIAFISAVIRFREIIKGNVRYAWKSSYSEANCLMEQILKPFVRKVKGAELPNFYVLKENVMLRFDTEKLLTDRMDNRFEVRTAKKRAFARNEFESYAKNNRFTKLVDLNTDGVL